MKTIHKILYSLFTFFVCGTSARAEYTGSGTACGPLDYQSSAVVIYMDISKFGASGKGWMHCSPNKWPTQAETQTTKNFEYGCVTYTKADFLHLYSCSFTSFACTSQDKYYDSTNGCISCATGTCSNSASATSHQNTSCSNCAAGYYSKNGTCTRCTTEFGSTGTTSGCLTKSSATQTKCYITSGSGSDTTGSFSITGTCYYQ